MNTEINDKRDSFRFEIVSKQKQEMFRKRRMDRLQINSSTNQPNQKLHLKCYDQLRVNQKVQDNFMILIQLLSGQAIYQIVMDLLDLNFHLYIMDNLKNQHFIQETLHTLSIIFQSTKLTVGQEFVKLGVLQYLLEYGKNLQYTLYCMNIFGNLSIERSDYGEILLHNKIHKQLFIFIQNSVLKVEVLREEDGKVLSSLVRLFSILAEVGEKSNMDYEQQMLQLLEICQILYERKLQIEHMIQIIYFVSKKMPVNTHSKVRWILDDLLANTVSKQPYLKSLLIVCSNLVFYGLNIKEIERIGVQIPQLLPYVVRILKKMVSKVELHHYFSTDLIWWEKIVQFASRTEDKNNILDILCTLEYPISEDWMFRFLYEFLQKNEHLTRQTLGLNFLKLLLRNEDEKIIYLIKAHQIHFLVQELCFSKNIRIREEGENILGQINAKNK